MLPRPLYVLTQLQAHHFLTRLYLLRVRGREPSPGVSVSAEERRRSATVDLGLCVTITRLFGRPPRLRTFLGITVGYHLACWSISGRTLGGMVTHQRLIAVDGSRVTPTQAMLRLAALPLSWILRRPIHDELAGTEVIQT